MHNHSYENEFNLHVNEISFSYEKMGTKTYFEEEAKGNSEKAYLGDQGGYFLNTAHSFIGKGYLVFVLFFFFALHQLSFFISDFHITHNAFCFPHKILHKLLSTILKCI